MRVGDHSLHRPRQPREAARAARGLPGPLRLRRGQRASRAGGRDAHVTPPFGLDHEAEYERVVVEPLLDALGRDHTVAVLLVRLGGYALGVLEGERVVASKVGTRFVKGRHKKGGSSANRFRRRREEQERDLIEAAAAEAARVLGPWRDKVGYVALGGDRTAVGRTIAERPELDWLNPLALERFFDVPDPRLRVLEELPYQLYAAKVVEGD